MTKRECKRIAQKIADLELVIRENKSPEETQKAKNKIMKICGSFRNIEDMMLIDEMAQEILNNS